MLTRPTSDQAESLKYLLSSNSFHTKNIVEWLAKSKDVNILTMTNPNTTSDNMFRHAGAVSILNDLLNEIEKITK